MDDRTLIDGVEYGPLAGLIGTWSGDKGLDVSPEPDGSEENPYFETIRFDPVGAVVNAGVQRLAAVRYHQVVSRKSDRKPFHDQAGHWMWDASAGVVLQSVSIPRGVCVLASGRPETRGDAVILAVQAEPEGIVQSAFMRDRARTTGFSHTITLRGDGLTYAETTRLEIYGKTFDHTDGNTLQRAR